MEFLREDDMKRGISIDEEIIEIRKSLARLLTTRESQRKEIDTLKKELSQSRLEVKEVIQINEEYRDAVKRVNDVITRGNSRMDDIENTLREAHKKANESDKEWHQDLVERKKDIEELKLSLFDVVVGKRISEANLKVI